MKRPLELGSFEIHGTLVTSLVGPRSVSHKSSRQPPVKEKLLRFLHGVDKFLIVFMDVFVMRPPGKKINPLTS